MTEKDLLIGPFTQVLSMANLPKGGSIRSEEMEVLRDAGIVIRDGQIKELGDFREMASQNVKVQELQGSHVALPGFIDAHTHICFGGSRFRDYAARNAGSSYLEIAANGGGIWDTVQKTRSAKASDLLGDALARIDRMMHNGVTTVEVKSGYGLSVEQELRQLDIINQVKSNCDIDVIPTCLAAHMKPHDYNGSNQDYLSLLVEDLLPAVTKSSLSNRVDIFVEEGAFSVDEGRNYLLKAKSLGFDVTVHGDQFSVGGSQLAIEVGAISVDHLEASDQKSIAALARSEVVSVVLPGASLGLGIDYAPARALLDGGSVLCIASDWNPGSAPMGNLLTQAALLGASQKLSDAEVFAGLTYRAARALNLSDRGQLIPGMLADLIAFTAEDYREILYHQGELKPSHLWKNGEELRIRN